MATGNVDSWTGEIAEIGAAYPFVGLETPLVIAGLIFWICWHIAQLKSESRELKEEVAKYGSPDMMRKILESQNHD